MGYTSVKTASGRYALACDKCGKPGEVRKRPCTYKVLTDSLRGARQELPYCHAPALCSPCFKELGSTKGVHAKCAEPAAEAQQRYDETEGALNEGDALVISAVQGDGVSAPEGTVGLTFVSRTGRYYRLMDATEYSEREDLQLRYSEAGNLVPWYGPVATKQAS